MSDSKVVLYQVRVMFKFIDKDFINFRIITDTEELIKSFVNKLCSVKGIERISIEYLCQYDCSLLGVFHNVSNLEVHPDEKI